MLATCHSYMSKQLAHLVPVLRKFLVKLPLIKVDQKKRGTLIPTCLLEDLVVLVQVQGMRMAVVVTTVYFSGDWDVHWEHGIWIHGQLECRPSMDSYKIPQRFIPDTRTGHHFRAARLSPRPGDKFHGLQGHGLHQSRRHLARPANLVVCFSLGADVDTKVVDSTSKLGRVFC